MTATVPIEQQYLKTTLAAAAAFQTWVDAADAAEAAERVHCFMLPEPEDPDPRNPDEYPREQLEALRPFALIFDPEDERERTEMVAVGTAAEFSRSGRLHVRFEQNAPDGIEGVHAETHQAFYEAIRDVLAGMDALPRGAGLYLAYTSHEIVTVPHWEKPEGKTGKGLSQVMVVSFDWGAG